MKNLAITKDNKSFLWCYLLAAAAALLLLMAAPAMAEDTRSFQRMGLTIELPARFGDPIFELDEEILWGDEAMQQDEPGIGVLLSLASTREEVLGELQAEGAISEQSSLNLGPRGFERFVFDFPAEGVSGIFYLSDDAYEGDSHVFLLIGTQPENLDAARGEIEAIAERIERINRTE